MRDNLRRHLPLMLVTDDRLVAGRDLVALAQAAEAGGVTCVQVRLKLASPRELVLVTRTLVAALTIPVIVNDRPDVAIAAGAAGVHLGADDLPVAMVRAIAPQDFIIGASVGSVAEVEGGADADYWGIGPWHATTTKGDAGAALGRDGFAAIIALAGGRPCVAIGGIRPDDVREVMDAGGAGVAVVSGVLGAEDVSAAARRYFNAVSDAARPAVSPESSSNAPRTSD